MPKPNFLFDAIHASFKVDVFGVERTVKFGFDGHQTLLNFPESSLYLAKTTFDTLDIDFRLQKPLLHHTGKVVHRHLLLSFFHSFHNDDFSNPVCK